MARERPTASNVIQPMHTKLDVWGGLTRAEAHALRRCEPLTPTLRHQAEQQGVSPQLGVRGPSR